MSEPTRAKYIEALRLGLAQYRALEKQLREIAKRKMELHRAIQALEVMLGRAPRETEGTK